MPSYIATLITIPASLLCALLLVGIGLAVTRTQSPQLIRKHAGADTYWSVQPERIDHVEGVLTTEHQPKHSRIIDDVNDAIGNDTVVLPGMMEMWESVGRRAVDSPVRHQRVHDYWMPPIGDIRITLLQTPTAEYLFARKSKDQLQPRMVRPYMLTRAVD